MRTGGVPTAVLQGAVVGCVSAKASLTGPNLQ